MAEAPPLTVSLSGLSRPPSSADHPRLAIRCSHQSALLIHCSSSLSSHVTPNKAPSSSRVYRKDEKETQRCSGSLFSPFVRYLTHPLLNITFNPPNPEILLRSLWLPYPFQPLLPPQSTHLRLPLVAYANLSLQSLTPFQSYQALHQILCMYH